MNYINNYRKIIWKNRLKRLIKRRTDNKFLFILSPPYCGSTLLNQILSSSRAVSANHDKGTREGQKLPFVREVMYDIGGIKRWDEALDFDWEFIKKEWMKYWDITRPILLEKSPPNIIRTQSIQNFFKPTYFIVFYRNPYAQCESIIRKYNATPIEAAKKTIRRLTYQKNNLESLRNTLQLSYEELTENPEQTILRFRAWLPELSDINIDQKFSAHNFKNKKMRITNLNDEKISKLTSKQVKGINSIFEEQEEILSFFGYKLLKIK